jgi:ATP-dependent Clp protease ATP-binding subunit ClpA
MKSPGFVRRFQMIDIPEPTVDEAKVILEQLRPSYEQFHHIKYGAGVVDYAVESSAKHILERRLPDKAIDLIDEAAAILKIEAGKNKRRARRTVTKKMIDEVLQKTCKVKAEALTDDTNQSLKSLYERISAKVYGQDEAVRNVVESVQMSKAGLLDDNKPLASLLFVGPTGVGKTEVAKVLAQELGVELIRFDMSEYTEKHSVAKLIGSPAGYVGYDDGGQLTDVIRKNPNCVLLLDEIEKANQEIYDILLQVIDYARLTDNKGRKADFRNVVIIMTSNAGAQYASQASIGFTGSVTRGDAMLKQVKKTFKPEFINRLSGTVVFHDMDKKMATLILKKKLGELQSKLEKKHVTMTLTDAAFESILSEGFVPEYGAREMDRVISQRLKPMLMREILFGKLSKGGDVEVDLVKDELKVSLKK